MSIKEQIVQLVEEKIVSTEIFLVDVKVSTGKIIVLIDDPKGIHLDDCVAINRYLHEKLDTTDIFEKHELEVGSPGMDEPLKILPQYKKRIGHHVSVLTFDGIKRTGTLVNADDAGLDLDEESTINIGKKKEIQKTLKRIPFKEIKETKLLFSFDKII